VLMAEKWDNLFWHQRQHGDQTKAGNIENNMTKDLVFILTNEKCRRVRNAFIQKIRELSKEQLNPGGILFRKCQANKNHICPGKDCYLVVLTPKDPKKIEPEKSVDGNIYDAVMEFEKLNLVFEVKTDSPRDESQIEKYKKELSKNGFKVEEIEMSWDDVYETFKKGEDSNNEVEKLLANEYLELIRVMDLTRTFDGFKGDTPSEHSSELRNLLAKLKDNGVIRGYCMESKTKNPWYWASFDSDKKNDKLHITLYRNNQNFECVLTHRWPKKREYGKDVANTLNEIANWNRNQNGQRAYGRTMIFCINDYRKLAGGQRGADNMEASILVRLDQSDPHRGSPEWVFDTIRKCFDISKDFGRRKQIQIGFCWSLDYNGKEHEADEWKDEGYAYEQTENVLKRLKILYGLLKNE